MPDTGGVPESRYVPAEVDRAVRARSDDRCVVPFCDATNWVQRSHRVPHRSGGSREAEQLDLLCDYHHHLYETGAILITGPADAPIITDAYGRNIDERRPQVFGCEGPPRGAAIEGGPAAGSAVAEPMAGGSATETAAAVPGATPTRNAESPSPPPDSPSGAEPGGSRSRRRPPAADGPAPPKL